MSEENDPLDTIDPPDNTDELNEPEPEPPPPPAAKPIDPPDNT